MICTEDSGQRAGIKTNISLAVSDGGPLHVLNNLSGVFMISYAKVF